MADVDLFGDVAAPVTHSKCGPQGGKHYVKPNGYFMPPGTGPAGEKCATCLHITAKGNVAGRYLKCLRMEAKWTGGRKTDILARSPACSAWAPRGTTQPT